MAKMYPALVSSETLSPGEIEIFHRLRDDPLTENWIVIHSLDIAEHLSQVSGEIDFIVIVPMKGILCLEVKAARSIRREDGLWYYGFEPKSDSRGPFKQASGGMHSIRKKVIAQYPQLGGIVFWSAVVFPYVDFTEQSLEWHSWQVIASRQFLTRSMGQNVLSVLDNARNFLSTSPNGSWFNVHSQEPDINTCKKIAAILRPDFEYYESPLNRTYQREKELKQYTMEQFDALDNMGSNSRVIFSGPAGTGKTLLAIEAARRSQRAAKRTLLVCFNRLLGNWLKDETATLSPDVVIATLHAYILSVAGIQSPENPPHSFWESDLPDLALSKLLENSGHAGQFDQLVIDEAQDILKEKYLDILDLSLKGGLQSGRWLMFGDFEKQTLYEDSSYINSILQERFSQVPRFSLRVNCRNTPRIAGMVHQLGGLKPGYSRVRRTDNKIDPQIEPFKTTAEQVAKLEKTLKNLQKEKVPLNEITILSSRRDGDCIANYLSEEWKSKIVSLKQNGTSKKIKYGTVHSYKGLEAPVIILTDIDQVASTQARMLFYVGITRALDRLYIFVNENARKEMLDILTNSAK